MSGRIQDNKRTTDYLVTQFQKQKSAESKALLDRLVDDLRKIETLQNGVQATMRGLRSTKTCQIGVATVVAPRKDANGTELEYWPELFDTYPLEIPVVAVLNRLGRPLKHAAVSHVIVPHDKNPPDFDVSVLARPLKEKFGDSLKRIQWRSKIVLDFIRLVRFVADRCDYVLWIEDDVSAPPNWLDRVLPLTVLDSKTWVFRYLAKGMPVVLVNTYYVDYLLQYLTHHFDDQPVDWLLNDCVTALKRRLVGTINITMPPPLTMFGHRGSVSSLEGAKVRPVY